jgi:hypothetical protein
MDPSHFLRCCFRFVPVFFPIHLDSHRLDLKCIRVRWCARSSSQMTRPIDSSCHAWQHLLLHPLMIFTSEPARFDTFVEAKLKAMYKDQHQKNCTNKSSINIEILAAPVSCTNHCQHETCSRSLQPLLRHSLNENATS